MRVVYNKVMNESASQNPWLASRNRTGAEYDAPYEIRAKAGFDIHGEANLVERILTTKATKPEGLWRVLDAGCGTGRLGIELARRGFDVVGVDLDEVMLAQARAKAPDLTWILSDLSSVSLDKRFDMVVMAGNVMIFLTPGTETAVVNNMVQHLKTDGLLLAAFELTAHPWSPLTIDQYDILAASAGLNRLARWSTWEQAPWQPGDQYAVSLHQK